MTSPCSTSEPSVNAEEGVRANLIDGHSEHSNALNVTGIGTSESRLIACKFTKSEQSTALDTGLQVQPVDPWAGPGAAGPVTAGPVTADQSAAVRSTADEGSDSALSRVLREIARWAGCAWPAHPPWRQPPGPPPAEVRDAL